MKIHFNHGELTLSVPAVMGILNITPDSFFDGGNYNHEKEMIEQAGKMIEEGADIIDVGAYSTRPQAADVSEEEELTRLIPAITLIRKKFPNTILSADTFRSRVAREAVGAGADMINDISGGGFENQHTENMIATAAALKTPYLLMHIQGSPSTMQQNPTYKNVVSDLKNYFSEKISILKKSGVEQIMIDPGFGFGKTIEHNYTLLKHLNEFESLGCPIVAGVSRKSMIYQLLHTTPAMALNGTGVLHTLALLNGATILRAHDVKEAKEAIKIINFIKNIK